MTPPPLAMFDFGAGLDLDAALAAPCARHNASAGAACWVIPGYEGATLRAACGARTRATQPTRRQRR